MGLGYRLCPVSSVSIKELVVVVQFDENVPEVNELVAMQNEFQTQLLVDHITAGGLVYCLNIRSDIRITKGMTADRTHRGIEIPVGEATIGRILSAVGDPLDGAPPFDTATFPAKTS